MFDVLNIPQPPMPAGALGMLVGITALLAGLALLLLGRVIVWRLAAGVVLGGLGAWATALLATRMDYPQHWPAVVVGVLLALVGIALAKLLWAAALAVAVTAATALILLHRMLVNGAPDAPEGFDATDMALGEWAAQTTRTLGEWLVWMVESEPMWTVAAGAVAAATALVLAMVRPVATRIFATSVAGAALVVGGAGLTITSLVGPLGLLTGWRAWAAIAVGAVMAVAGMAYQAHSRQSPRPADNANTGDTGAEAKGGTPAKKKT